jgi:predicted deacylase
MRFHPKGSESQPNVRCGFIEFENPILGDWQWPCVEIKGHTPGPRLCVMAGIHINEVSSIGAAVRIADAFSHLKLHGSLSILPVVNVPAITRYTEYTCPVDGKNINFSFPGSADGSFSEALAFALLHEWAADADVLIDLHGGDLREAVTKWVMFQHTGDAEFDARNEELALCFGARFVEPLKAELINAPGRSCTGRAVQKRLAVMSEGGSNGLVDSVSVQYHMTGVFNIARHLGMIEGVPVAPLCDPVIIDRRTRLEAPASGFSEPNVEVSACVTEGQVLANIRDFHGQQVAEIRASEMGFILAMFTNPVVEKGQWLMSIAVPAADFTDSFHPRKGHK